MNEVINNNNVNYKVYTYITRLMQEVQNLQEQDQNCNIAFRGEARKHVGSELQPSLFRNDYSKKEQKLFDLLRDYGIVSQNSNKTEQVIGAQHYVSISRALDITYSLLPALYFACEKYNDLHDKKNLKDGIIYVFGFPEYISPHSRYIDDYYSKEFGNMVYDKNFKVISHSEDNERITAQKGGFIFFQGQTYNPINEIYFRRVDILGADKKQILEELNILFDVNEATIYPDKGRIGSIIVKDKFEKITSEEDSISVENEVINALRRLEYELMIEKRNNPGTFTELYKRRRLRKEKMDILSFVEKFSSPEGATVACEDIKKYVNNRMIELGGI